MTSRVSLDELWNTPSRGELPRAAENRSDLPLAARKYLGRATPFAQGSASAVRLKMHGEIKLRRWLPFRAEEVIRWDRGMIWQATVRMFGLPIRGSDRLVDGAGAMRWQLLGILPVVKASGPDITRSTAGRLAGESVWLPSALQSSEVRWKGSGVHRAVARFEILGEPVGLQLTFRPPGRLATLRYSRWGNPDGNGFRYVDFGGVVERDGLFDGFRIPTQLRLGWFFGTDRFEEDGEFFRVHVDQAFFR